MFTFLCRIIIVMALCFFSYGCSDQGQQKTNTFTRVKELEEIRPEKPVKIKVKRNAKGQYSWDLSGNTAEQIVEVDRKLNEALN